MKETNPIQIGSKWIDSSGNLWEVTSLLPGGKVDLFDRQRVWFRDTYQWRMRAQIITGNLTQKGE